METRVNDQKEEAQKGLELAKQNNYFSVIEKQQPFGERRDLDLKSAFTTIP